MSLMYTSNCNYLDINQKVIEMRYENLSDMIKLLHSTRNENMAIYGAILKVTDPKEIKGFYNGYLEWVKTYGGSEETKTTPEPAVCKKINRLLQHAVKNTSDAWHAAVPELNACKTEKTDANLFETFYKEHKNQAVYEAINIITDPQKIKNFTEGYIGWGIDNLKREADPKLVAYGNIHGTLGRFGGPYADIWLKTIPDLEKYIRHIA